MHTPKLYKSENPEGIKDFFDKNSFGTRIEAEVNVI